MILTTAAVVAQATATPPMPACIVYVNGKKKIVACPGASPWQTPSPSPSPTASPTSTPTPSPSPSPTPSPTPTPTLPPSPTPSPSPTATPTATPTPPAAVTYHNCAMGTASSPMNVDVSSWPTDPSADAIWTNASAHLVGYDGATTRTFATPAELHLITLAPLNSPTAIVTGSPPYHKFGKPMPYLATSPGLYIEQASDGAVSELIPAGDGDPTHCFDYELSQAKFSAGPPAAISAYSGQPQSLGPAPWSLWLDQMPLPEGDIGSNADGMVAIEGELKPEDVANAPLQHALNFRFPSCASTYRIFVAPASTNDAGYGCALDTSPNPLPAGAHIVLRADYPCSSLPTQKAINTCIGLQRHGAYGNNTAAAFEFDVDPDANTYANADPNGFTSQDLAWMGTLKFGTDPPKDGGDFRLVGCTNGLPLSTCTKGPFWQMADVLQRASGGFLHRCPGCDTDRKRSTGMHVLPMDGRWTFNGNMEKPTFTPSFKHEWNVGDRPEDARVCHYILTDGVLHYCADSTHELAGRAGGAAAIR